MGDPPDLAMLDALEELARAEPDSVRQTIDCALWQEYKVYLYAVGIVYSYLAVSLITWKGFVVGNIDIPKRLMGLYFSDDALSEQGCIRLHRGAPEYFARRVNRYTPVYLRLCGHTYNHPLVTYVDVSTLRVHRHQLSTEIHHSSRTGDCDGLVKPF